MLLIVEDDPVVRHLLERIAHRLRHASRSAETIADARAVLACEPVDAAMCDIALPDGDGLDFAASVREGAEGERLPFAICTARADAETVRRAIHVGVTDFIRKPIDIADVMTRMERLLGRAPRRWLGWPELRDRFNGDPRAWRAATAEAQRSLADLLARDAADPALGDAARAAAECCAAVGGERSARLARRLAGSGPDGPGEPGARELRAALAIELRALEERAVA